MSLYGQKLLVNEVPELCSLFTEEQIAKLASLQSQIADALVGMCKEFASYTMTPSLKREIDSLKNTLAFALSHNLDEHMASVLVGQTDPTLILSLVQKQEERKALLDEWVAWAKSKIASLSNAASLEGHAAFVQGLKTTTVGDKQGSSTRKTYPPIDCLGKRVACNFGKTAAIHVIVTGERTYRAWQIKENWPFPRIIADSDDTPLPEKYSLSAPSSVRRLADCLFAEEIVSEDTLKSHSNGIGVRIDEHGGTLAYVHYDAQEWEQKQREANAAFQKKGKIKK